MRFPRFDKIGDDNADVKGIPVVPHHYIIKLTTPAACAVAPAGVVINIAVVPVICILALHKGGRADRRERGCCLWMWEVQVVHTDLCSNCVELRRW